jgi:hypothetical protein
MALNIGIEACVPLHATLTLRSVLTRLLASQPMLRVSAANQQAAVTSTCGLPSKGMRWRGVVCYAYPFLAQGCECASVLKCCCFAVACVLCLGASVSWQSTQSARLVAVLCVWLCLCS